MEEVTRNSKWILNQIRSISNLIPYSEYENLIQMLTSPDTETQIVAEEIVKSLTDISGVDLLWWRYFDDTDVSGLLWKS